MLKSSRPVWVVLCLVASSVVGLLARHVFDYFFLFDDFALVGQAGGTPWRTLFTTTQIGFFRPLPFLILRSEFLIFGWTFSFVYALDAALIHCTNAVLVGLLARELRFGRLAWITAGMLFGVSASAGEGYFWVSAVFDRFCTLGVLIALISAIRCMFARTIARQCGWATLGVAGATLALLSKESAVVLPALIVTMGANSSGRRWRSLLFYAGVLTVAVGILLIWRERLLPNLGGAYGQMPSLFAHASVGRNLWLYLRAIWHVPLPWHDASPITGVLASAAWILSAGSWCISAAVLARRRSLTCMAYLICFIATLAPVA